MPKIIVDLEVEGFFKCQVIKSDDMGSSFHPDFYYDVVTDGVLRHPKCDSEAVMRALGHYLQSAQWMRNKYQQQLEKQPTLSLDVVKHLLNVLSLSSTGKVVDVEARLELEAFFRA